MTVANNPITINLPNRIYHRLQQAVQTSNHSLEELLLQTIEGNMPPIAAEAPLEI